MKSKTHLGKRALSIILSAIMVVTMLPTFAISASADDISTHLTGRYFSNDNEWYNAATSANGLEWQNYATDYTSYKNGMHYFSGNVALKINDNVTSGITSSSGMTLSFYFRKNETVNHHQLISFGSQAYNTNANTQANSFYVSSAGNWMMPDAHESKGALFVSYVDGSGAERLNCYPDFDFEENTVYNCTIIITTSGVKYYIDGELKNTLVANNSNNPAGAGSYPTNYTDYLDDALTAVGGFTTNYFGLSRWRDGFFKGAMGDFRIYNRAMTDTEFFDNNVNEYASKMSSGIVFTKMADAYNAYVDYNEALDANAYGNNAASATVATAKQNFAVKVAKMKPWTAYTGTYSTSAADSTYSKADLVNSDQISNVLYTYGLGGDNYSSDVRVTKCYCRTFYGPIVFLQNNSGTMACPMNIAVHRNGSGTRRIRNCYSKTTGFSFTKYWYTSNKGGSNGTTWNNSTYQTGSSYIGYQTGDDSNASDNLSENYFFFSNTLHCSVNVGNNYTSNYTPTFGFEDNDSNTSYGEITDSKTIYVVNYDYYITQVCAANGLSGIDVANYKEGGLLPRLQAYDTATSYDPRTELPNSTSTNVSDGVTAVSASFTANVSALTSSAMTTDTAAGRGYIALRNALDYSGVPTAFANSVVAGRSFTMHDMYNSNGYIYDTNGDSVINSSDKQLNGFSDFATAYSNAVGVMAALGTAGYNTNNTSNYTDSTAGAKATALMNAFNALNIIDLHVPVISINNGDGGAYVGKNNGVTIAGTGSETVQYSVRTSTDGGSNWTAWSSYTDYSAEVKPFSSLADSANANNWAEIKTRSTDGNNHYSDESAATQIRFLSAPSYTTTGNGDELVANDTVTISSTNGLASGLQYSYTGNADDWHSYTVPVVPFTENSTKSAVTVYMRQISGTSASPVTAFPVYKNVQDPGFSVSNGAYLDKYHGVSPVNNPLNTEEGEVTYEYHYENSNTFVTCPATLYPFSSMTDEADSTSKTIYLRAVRNGKVSNPSSITVYYLSRPVADDNGKMGILTADDGITVTSTNDLKTGLKYSIDGGSTWTDIADGASFKPFTLNSTATSLNVQIKQVSGDSTSPIYSETVYKVPTAPQITSDGTYLDKTHGVSAARNTGDNDDVAPDAYYYRIDNGSWLPYTQNTKIFPFSGVVNDDASSTVTVSFKCERTVGSVLCTSAVSSVEVTYLSRPSTSTADGDVLVNGTDKIAFASTCGLGTTGMEYQILDETNSNAVLQDWTSYTEPVNPFVNGKTMVTVKARQNNGDCTSAEKVVQHIKMQTNKPTVSSNNSTSFLNKDTGYTIVNNDVGATTYYQVWDASISNWGAEQTYTPGTVIKPFENYNSTATTTYYVRFRSERHGVDSGWSDSVVFRYLNAPTINNTVTGSALTNNDELTGGENLRLIANNTSDGTLKYYISDDNGSTWDAGHEVAENTDFAPFALDGYRDDVKLKIKATQTSGSCESVPTDVFTIIRKVNTASMYWKPDGSNTTNTKFFDENGVFFIDNTLNDYSGKTIYYQKVVNGYNSGTFYSYNINNGIDSDDYTSYDVVTFKFYIIENSGKTIVAKATFMKEGTVTDSDTNMLVYRESFDGATASGTTFTKNSSNQYGQSGIIANSGTVSVEAGAGGDYDYRKNVLKINAATGASRGNYLQFNNNPLAFTKNADIAKVNGVTISFWRHMNADCSPWLNSVVFTKYDSTSTDNRYKYLTLTATGRFSLSNKDSNNSGGGHIDYFPNDNDITNHSASVVSGYWTHIALTIDPSKSNFNDAVIMYINGEPHNISSTSTDNAYNAHKQFAGMYSTMSDTERVQAILDFITDADTHFDLGYGAHDENDKNLDMWMDDIRIYTKVKTQVDINNMYTDDLNDAKAAGVNYKSSTSHDPANVTVYTFKSEYNYTNVNGNSATKAAGSQVGQEFIDYYNVDLSLVDIDYYSFGTGLTVYHSTDNLNWEVIGDSQGRCGYQNQDLFVSSEGESQPYYTTLATPLAYAAQGTSHDGGNVREGAAGKLVWAPEVVYNLKQDKWMYYGSTSAWQSSYSAIFMLTSDTVDHGYKYQGMIVKTSDGQKNTTRDDGGTINAIDACVYYAHDSLGRIKPDELHMIYGSWGDIMHISLNADGTSNSDTYIGDRAISISVGGGEGGYMVYDNGYYYYYISPGSNGWASAGGGYHIRVYRSEHPDRDFVSISGSRGMVDELAVGPHGNSMLTGYDNSQNNYLYSSTGHSSVYKVYNNLNEPVLVNAAHTREYTHNSAIPVEDGALSTRQIWLIGNVAIQNPVVYTQNGWPVAFPLIYDNTFSTKFKGENWRSWVDDPSFSAYDIEGTYAINEMLIEPYPHAMNEGADKGYATNKTYTIIASEDKKGVFLNNATNKGYPFEITPSDDGSITYFTVYENEGYGTASQHVYAEGVFANQGTWNNNDTCKPEFAMVTHKGTWDGATDTLGGKHIVGVRTQAYPRDAVNAGGDKVKIDNIIYTRKSSTAETTSFAMYGTEISDNYNYLSTGLGERVTTLKVTYPYYINTADSNAIICLDDDAYIAAGCTASSIKAELLGFYNSSGGYLGNTNSDYTGDGSYALYKLTGNVSDYFKYYNGTIDPLTKTTRTGYPETGVKLLIQYTDGSSTYGEYEFPFVSPNPAMAHSITGIRNTSNAGQDARVASSMFTRFVGSYGNATTLLSDVSYNYDYFTDKNSDAFTAANTTAPYFGTGTFNYLDSFSKDNAASVASENFDSPSHIKSSMTFYSSSEGINSGAYAITEHSNHKDSAYSIASYVVDADYYIDYSDKSNSLINYTSDSSPTGYSFDFIVSNLKWNPKTSSGLGATSYYRNNTGLSVTASLINTPSSNTISGNSSWHGYDNKYVLAYNNEEMGRKAMSSYFNDPSVYPSDKTKSVTDGGNDWFTVGLNPVFNTLEANADTDTWKGKITLTGKDSVAKKNLSDYAVSSIQHNDTYGSETISYYRGNNAADNYANFVYEKGTYTGGDGGVSASYYGGEEVYAYYNIGVSTCDKGAVRNFVDRWANKEMSINNALITELSDAEIRGTDSVKGDIETITTRDVEIGKDGEGHSITSTDIYAGNYSIESYNKYLDALAEAYWFVNNPKNTKLGDYSGYTSDMGDANASYTTAYGNVNGGYHQMIYHAEHGANIFKDKVGNEYVDTQTDKVQAKIIADVLIAYKNLFSKEEYKEIKDNFDGVKFYDSTTSFVDSGVGKTYINPHDATSTNVQAIIIDGASPILNSDYTDDSWDGFVEMMKDLALSFDYYTNDAAGTEGYDKSDYDIHEWRHVPLSADNYEQINALIDTAKTTLMPKVDISALQATYALRLGNSSDDANNKSVLGGIFTTTAQTIDERAFEAGEQVFTYGSWAELKSYCEGSYPYIDSSDALFAQNHTISVNVEGGTSGETKSITEGKYAVDKVIKYNVGGVTYYAQNFTASENAYSTEQTTVNTRESTLAAKQLAFVDTKSAYESYDAAKAAVDSIDRNKYIDSALTAFDTAVSGYNANVYMSVASATGLPDGDVPAGTTIVKKTSLGLTDEQTVNILTAVSNLDSADNIKTFKATITVQGTGTERDGTTAVNVKYGQKVIHDILLGENEAALYSVTYYDGTSEVYDGGWPAEGHTTGSQKFYCKDGSIEMIADKNMAIVADVSKTDVSTSDTRVNIYNAYRVLEKIVYTSTTPTYSGATLTWSGGSYTTPQIPFYSCTSWSINFVNGVYEAKPLYALNNDGSVDCSFDTTVGDVTESAKYDEVVTLSVTDDDLPDGTTFKGWAAINNVGGADKYAVISYAKEYKFFAVTSENFAPIVKSGDDYYIVTDKNDTMVKLTNSNIDCTITLNVDKDALINQKLDYNAPFISVIMKVAPQELVDDHFVMRAYCRVSTTNGINDLGGKIHNISNPNNVKDVKASKVLESGQFSISLLKSKNALPFEATQYRYNCYVSYSYDYEFNGETYTMNAIDYAREI